MYLLFLAAIARSGVTAGCVPAGYTTVQKRKVERGKAWGRKKILSNVET